MKRQRGHPQVAKAAATTEAEGEGFEEQAQQLQAEISEQLARATDAVLPAAPAKGKGAKQEGAEGSKRPPALSRMTKPQLIAECEERNIDSAGTVAELRVRLRLDRKRDALVAELLDRGWSERQSRRALGAVGWDLDDAIALLTAPKKK